MRSVGHRGVRERGGASIRCAACEMWRVAMYVQTREERHEVMAGEGFGRCRRRRRIVRRLLMTCVATGDARRLRYTRVCVRAVARELRAPRAPNSDGRPTGRTF